MEDLSDWLQIEEFSAATGKSRRTIERLIQRQQIVCAKRKSTTGRKPVVVIDPTEVTRHKGTFRPVVQSANRARETAKPPAVSQVEVKRLLKPLMKALDRLRIPLSAQLYLSEKEAALYLGFPQAEVKRLVRSNFLPSIRLLNRQRRIRRIDVDAFVEQTKLQPSVKVGIERGVHL